MYEFYLPFEPLRPYIDVYWRLRSGSYVVDKQVFVDGCADLIFNFGAAYQRSRMDTGSGTLQTSSTLDSHRDHPLAIHQSGQIDLLGIRFRPGGLAAFIPIPASELVNDTLDLHASFGSDAAALEHQLFDAAADPLRQIGLLNGFFFRRLTRRDPHIMTRILARQIEQRGGLIAMRALSDDAGYSIRTVDRLFRMYFGVSPKFYARIVRFQRAISFLASAAPSTLTDAAFQFGYYDLAHFSKESLALTGLSAEACRSFMLAMAHAPPPHLVQFLQERDALLP